MFPRYQRLRREKDIMRARRARPVSRGDLMSVRAYDRNDKDPSRFAVIVGKRVSAKAVSRNRVARQIRGALFEIHPRIALGRDILVVAHRPADRYSYAPCKAELTHHVTSIGAWR